ncbi:hypothetical protein V8E52_005128 [Russula decolorans]
MTPRDAVSAIANIEPAPLNFRDRRPHEDPDDYAVYSNGLLTTFYEDGCSLRDFKVYHRPPQLGLNRTFLGSSSTATGRGSVALQGLDPKSEARPLGGSTFKLQTTTVRSSHAYASDDNPSLGNSELDSLARFTIPQLDMPSLNHPISGLLLWAYGTCTPTFLRCGEREGWIILASHTVTSESHYITVNHLVIGPNSSPIQLFII